jgi:hypothetical protein
MEGGEVFEKVAFLAESEAINDGNAMRPVEGSERFGNLRVRVHRQIPADIWQYESIVVDGRDFICRELKHLMDHFARLLTNIIGMYHAFGSRRRLTLAAASGRCGVGREARCERGAGRWEDSGVSRGWGDADTEASISAAWRNRRRLLVPARTHPTRRPFWNAGGNVRIRGNLRHRLLLLLLNYRQIDIVIFGLATDTESSSLYIGEDDANEFTE